MSAMTAQLTIGHNLFATPPPYLPLPERFVIPLEYALSRFQGKRAKRTRDWHHVHGDWSLHSALWRKRQVQEPRLTAKNTWR